MACAIDMCMDTTQTDTATLEHSYWDDVDFSVIREAQDKIGSRDIWAEQQYDDTSELDGEIAAEDL